MEILTELCQELRNWFDRNQPKYYGDFKIEDGALVLPLKDGQYFRIIGSLLNDGVHQYGDVLVDEEFSGAVWSMAIPPAVLSLAKEIEDWISKYGDVMTSPFSSESFGGYSYSKAQGYAGSNGGGMLSTWQAVFADRLNRWRKIL